MKNNGSDFAERFAEPKETLYFVKTSKGGFCLTEEGYKNFSGEILEQTKLEVSQEEFENYTDTKKMTWQEVKERINNILENNK